MTTDPKIEAIARFFSPYAAGDLDGIRAVLKWTRCNLSGDQHQMDAFVWANYALAPIPARLADGTR
ncbi:hypothetical protein GCM10017786_37660 [Amycolatopsis deserti]|uniref:Uncharacterized protein n=1 Tax=Amycolatopsis deserti TaxID=185696 RepID=A0ABQ3J280_9PSEU|nr:hypothetical protein [Amycolatopsis deserti]GHF01151.1 hypothetical protein GCM10017786_37660 [Amycolatopsis deserti]